MRLHEPFEPKVIPATRSRATRPQWLRFVGRGHEEPEGLTVTDPRRFDVAITRARLKLIVVASELALSLVPHREEVLLARQHLLACERFCADRDGRFVLTEGELSSLP